MQNLTKCILVFLTVAMFLSFATPGRGTLDQPDLTGFDRAVFSDSFDDLPKAVLSFLGEPTVGSGTTCLLAANKDANGKNGDKKGNDKAEEEEEEDDNGGEDSGFDRLWDVTCCG